MLETSFSSFISKKPGEIPIFGTFFDEKLNFGKSVVWAKSTIMTSL